ncbi:MAG: discoidin domain-containing protein [Gammaproteobacteria bacterium]|nr:discoidin domain-containing protein [Gammaproteobacteria bacterium]
MRYWRLNFTAGNSVAILLAEFRLIAGGTNVAIGCPATADGQYSSTYAPGMAVDNNVATHWQYNAAYPHWLKVDLGAATSIGIYEVVAEDAAGATYSPTAWTLESSEDGVIWTERDAQSGLTWTNGEVKTFVIALPVTITGNATIATGAAVDSVVIREATTRAHVETIIPAVNGDWTADVMVGQYDISYFASGCQPICHGPYTIE